MASELKRQTTNLTPRAQAALEKLMALEGRSATDVINLALLTTAAVVDYKTEQGYIAVLIPQDESAEVKDSDEKAQQIARLYLIG